MEGFSNLSKGFPGGSVAKNLPAKQETWDWSLGWEDPLEKEMATHSSILAWQIPWTEEPGGLQSMGWKKSWTWLSDWTTTTPCLPESWEGSREMMYVTGTHFEKKTSPMENKVIIHILIDFLFFLLIIITSAVSTIQVPLQLPNLRSPRTGSAMTRGCHWLAPLWPDPDTPEENIIQPEGRRMSWHKAHSLVTLSSCLECLLTMERFRTELTHPNVHEELSK